MIQFITGLVRHILTFGGGFVVADGWTTPEQWDTAVGAVITLVGVLWSVYEKFRVKPA